MFGITEKGECVMLQEYIEFVDSLKVSFTGGYALFVIILIISFLIVSVIEIIKFLYNRIKFRSTSKKKHVISDENTIKFISLVKWKELDNKIEHLEFEIKITWKMIFYFTINKFRGFHLLEWRFNVPVGNEDKEKSC